MILLKQQQQQHPFNDPLYYPTEPVPGSKTNLHFTEAGDRTICKCVPRSRQTLLLKFNTNSNHFKKENELALCPI